MKQIMISIKPQWVEKIFNGEKTLEIRKTMPKCELPCKVYIYCTKDEHHKLAQFKFLEGWFYKKYDDTTSWAQGCTVNIGEDGNGRVVAEFTLNKIDLLVDCGAGLHYVDSNYNPLDLDYLRANSCLKDEQIYSYLGLKGGSPYYNDGFVWHIDDLKIYDKPKELSEFGTILKRMKGKESRFTIYLLQRPPQSWCYVEGEIK